MKTHILIILKQSAVNFFLNFFANQFNYFESNILAKNFSENEVVQLKKINTETNNESENNSSREIAEKYGKKLSDESYNHEKKYSIFINIFFSIMNKIKY